MYTGDLLPVIIHTCETGKAQYLRLKTHTNTITKAGPLLSFYIGLQEAGVGIRTHHFDREFSVSKTHVFKVIPTHYLLMQGMPHVTNYIRLHVLYAYTSTVCSLNLGCMRALLDILASKCSSIFEVTLQSHVLRRMYML